MPDYTNTLKRIQEDPEDFYQGSIAREIVEDIQTNGGIISLEDLMNFKVRTSEPLNCQIGNLTFHTASVPFGGPVVLQILNILRGE